MEQSVAETLSIGLLLCRLLLGTADCGDGVAAASAPTDPCAGPVPRHQLVIGGAVLGRRDAAVLANRLTRAGACEVVVSAVADGAVVLELATAEEPMDLVGPMLRPGTLAFFAVDERLALGQSLPADRVVMTDIDGQATYIVSRAPLLHDEALESAAAELSIYDEWTITLDFTDKGTERFGAITTDMVGQVLAIALDGEVLSAPRIMDPIVGGRAMISGGFSADEARDLAALIASGPLPDGLSILSIQALPVAE